MEWLHFSDFHIGGKRGPQEEALGTLIDAVREKCALGVTKIDAVFLVGDISYSGKKEEFARFKSEFLEPLLEIPQVKDAKIFAVPGNHDVECDATLPITWQGIRNRNQQIFFNEDDDGRAARKQRSVVFQNYWDFVKSCGIISPNPFEEVSALTEIAEFPFDVLSVNTAFFSDFSEDSSAPITPSPISSVRKFWRATERKKPVLILAHHPITCFIPEHQKPFETLIIDRRSVVLHGHEHNPKAVFNSDGTLRTLGFGAAYVEPLQKAAVAPYTNSFAYCKIDGDLRLNGYSWDASSGRWLDATASQFATCINGGALQAGEIRLQLPFGSQHKNQVVTVNHLKEVPRKSPRLQSIVPILAPNESIWLKLLFLSDNVNSVYRQGEPEVASVEEPDGRFRFILEIKNQRHLLLCIPSVNHLLSSTEIEALNTQLDSDDFSSATIVSLGKMSDDGRSIYLRLKTKKPIEAIVNQDLTASSEKLLSQKQRDVLAVLDSAEYSSHALIGEDEIYLLLIKSKEGVSSFNIINSAASILPPTHAIVSALRKGNQSFGKMRYGGEDDVQEELQLEDEFDENAYLSECHKEYNVMKYAALANVGLRFTEYSLEDIYVSASASETGDSSSSRLGDFLDDHLAAYPASDALKAHIKNQYLRMGEGPDRQESLKAREFCQKYGAVLLTGDPGSGKTCFLKSEILAYCERAKNKPSGEDSIGNWHSSHIPLFVQLSQAVAEKDLESTGILAVASRLLERKGVCFPLEEMEGLLQLGRLAIFFDGLDEVVSVEKRALVVQHINDLVSRSLKFGNRFVVTSRPAAVHVVNLLPALHQLELQGLTKSEIRELAKRILDLKLSETPEGVVIDRKNEGKNDGFIISQILQDCDEKPGVARLAQNPLLLTLLVMIYANYGAPSAKRHLIYAEAIKTLAAVRGREAGHEPIAVQDLRERLGAVALSVYKKESGFLPSRKEVAEIIQGVMRRQRGGEVSRHEASRFVQKVAESTGLISIGGGQDGDDDTGIVTFMHHSFLEYFAAVGISKEFDSTNFADLVSEPRWMEILTLLAGIVGENEDVAPVIAKILTSSLPVNQVDAKLLIFSIDCALECDVPSESALMLLSSSTKECISTGAAKTDPWVRSELGERLAQLFAACGSSVFDSMLADLIDSSDSTISAAAIAVASYACGRGYESKEILRALEKVSERTDEATLCALCFAAAEVEIFRTPVLLQVVARSLTKTQRCKQAAFDAIARIPGLASKHWGEIINGMDEQKSRTRRLASLAALQAGFNADVAALSDSRKQIVVRALKNADGTLSQNYHVPKVQRATVESLINSAFERDVIIGVQLVPHMEDDAQVVYSKLFRILDERNEREVISNALRALRRSSDARILFVVGDLKKIAKFLTAGTSDVRIAAANLLSAFGRDAEAVKALLELDYMDMQDDEFRACVQALNKAEVMLPETFAKLFAIFEQFLKEGVKRNAHWDSCIRSLLETMSLLETTAPPSCEEKLKSMIEDYRLTPQVRSAAFLCYSAVSMPSKASIEFITKIFSTTPKDWDSEIVQIPSMVAKNCRQSVDYVVASVDALKHLFDAAIVVHSKYSKRPPSDDVEYYVSELRVGITSVSQIIIAFNEFLIAA